MSDRDIRVEPWEIDPKWPKLYGLAVTWQEVAAVWMTRNPGTDAYTMYSEYCVPPTSVSHHAAELAKRGDWIQGVMTATDIGRNEKDGYALVGKYRAMKLRIDVLQSNEEAMILDLQEALRTGKLKVFGNLPRLFDQYRMYRRTEKGVTPDRNVGMIKAMLVCWAGRKKMKAPAEPKRATNGYADQVSNPSGGGWMAN